jgi:hypothetical protein
MSIVRYRCEEPIMAADRPWEEGSFLRPVSVIPEPDGSRLRLYYLVWHRPDFSKNLLCLAYSTDAFHWEKPDLGEGNNIVLRPSGLGMPWGAFHPTRVIHDPSDEDEKMRWKCSYWGRPSPAHYDGMCLAASPDGLRFRDIHGRPIATNQNDGMCLIDVRAPSPVTWLKSRYYIYQQAWKFNPDLPTDKDNLKMMERRIVLWSAETFGGRWIGPITVLEPDADDPPDLQIYWLSPFHTTSGYGGWINCHHTGSQQMDIQLASSPDGFSWTRELNRKSVLSPGGRGRFDAGMVATKCGPFRWQGKLYNLYNGQSWTHDQRPRYEGDATTAGMGIVELDPSAIAIP